MKTVTGFTVNLNIGISVSAAVSLQKKQERNAPASDHIVVGIPLSLPVDNILQDHTVKIFIYNTVQPLPDGKRRALSAAIASEL